VSENDERFGQLETEIERRLLERFAALRDEFDRLRMEADRRWAGFLTRFDQNFAGIVPKELFPAPVSAPAEPRGAAGHVSIDDVRTLDEGDNQVEVLRRFLDLCRRHASRAVLFVARPGGLEAWKAVGFSDRGGNDEAIRKTVAGVEDDAIRRALDGVPSRTTGPNGLSSALDVRDASLVVLVPMVIRERVSGLVYADAAAGDEDGFDPDAIALLTYLAGGVVDRLSTRRLRPSPSLRTVDDVAPGEAEAAPREDALRDADLAGETPPPESLMAREASSPPSADVEEPQSADFELAEPEPEPEPAPPPPSFAAAPSREAPAAPPAQSATARVEEGPAEAPGTSWQSEPAHAEEAPGSWRSDVEPPPMPRGVELPPRPEPPIEPPAAATRRLAGPLAPADGDERREEARRFARLLVSEIKLYNERAVMEGRERGDLYKRLREDIDRSRQMYDERIPQDVRSNSNFFYEEMVRILADGRPDVLGL